MALEALLQSTAQGQKENDTYALHHLDSSLLKNLEEKRDKAKRQDEDTARPNSNQNSALRDLEMLRSRNKANEPLSNLDAILANKKSAADPKLNDPGTVLKPYDAEVVTEAALGDVKPNANATMSWNVKNTGRYPFDSQCKLAFVDGDGLLVNGYSIPNCQPGAYVWINVSFNAFRTPGAYETFFRLTHDNIQFGPRLHVKMNVVTDVVPKQKPEDANNNARIENEEKSGFPLQPSRSMVMQSQPPNNGQFVQSQQMPMQPQYQYIPSYPPSQPPYHYPPMYGMQPPMHVPNMNNSYYNPPHQPLMSHMDNSAKDAYPPQDPNASVMMSSFVNNNNNNASSNNNNVNLPLSAVPPTNPKISPDNVAPVVESKPVKDDVLLCVCGKELTFMEVKEAYKANRKVYCDVCKQQERNHVWHCMGGYDKNAHPGGFDMCAACATQQLGRAPVIDSSKNQGFDKQKPSNSNIPLDTDKGAPYPILEKPSAPPESNPSAFAFTDADAKFMYPIQLRQLIEMGFDREKIRRLLLQHRGDMSITLGVSFTYLFLFAFLYCGDFFPFGSIYNQIYTVVIRAYLLVLALFCFGDHNLFAIIDCIDPITYWLFPIPSVEKKYPKIVVKLNKTKRCLKHKLHILFVSSYNKQHVSLGNSFC
ncbi:hypothetical protein RFI_25462 [Reticulomyxa filosa]|uniref:UBA domain-containing protein n=1 Tax=Reticulomyxa filosa TaxID=46433 RepID=X6MD40_RETFI|nr:hypothetical protein RFI_25462 [Reticulomyxa filosa]|eukprot:ETO11913.1 hypothetical protein RFI_25462 [Reticulomyxa filosa]